MGLSMPKVINGILGSDGQFIRSAKTRSWEKAEEFKRELEHEYESRQNGGPGSTIFLCFYNLLIISCL